MGKSRVMSSKFLASKLRTVRLELAKHEGIEISQTAMIKRLMAHDKRIKRLNKSNISGYERGTHVPPPPVLLAYARLAGVCMERLVDDRLKLPDRLPVRPGHDP
jgi:hypothetical protein